MKIDKSKEYDFIYTEEYGKGVDDILNILIEEYPLNIKKINKANVGFEVTGLIIHAINYSRQLKEVQRK